MSLIKQIDKYILKNFFKTFSVTFLMSLFVLVMQFMFQYMDDLVGKGVGFWVIAEFFTYAALSIVPLALPLSILLASLMTFGNLGERMELIAMKSAGVSLFRIMRSLIIIVSLISVGSFFFSDRILPKTQVKMWSLLFSIREKSPELDIPEGAFYSGITGRNIYVGQKINGMLKNVIIYDYSDGFKNMSIILADTGYISFTQDKKNILIQLKTGETFENFHDAYKDKRDVMPYRRETFQRKNLLVDYDANFTEMDDGFLRNQYVAYDIKGLRQARDSTAHVSDSLEYEGDRKSKLEYFFGKQHFNAENTINELLEENKDLTDYNTSEIYKHIPDISKKRTIEDAIQRVKYVISDRQYYTFTKSWIGENTRRFNIEYHKRFSLSFACLIFLFIGAPLGAIIRKGGLGMPVVLSAILFIMYYIIDNIGYKMARECIWEVWEGMWFSAAILLPLGIVLTVMAAKDSSIMNGESYLIAIKKFFSKENCIFAKRNKNKTQL